LTKIVEDERVANVTGSGERADCSWGRELEQQANRSAVTLGGIRRNLKRTWTGHLRDGAVRQKNGEIAPGFEQEEGQVLGGTPASGKLPGAGLPFSIS